MREKDDSTELRAMPLTYHQQQTNYENRIRVLVSPADQTKRAHEV